MYLRICRFWTTWQLIFHLLLAGEMNHHIKNIGQILLWISLPLFIIQCSDSKKVQKNTGPAYSSIQVRYADSLKVKPEEIVNEKLYAFIDDWMHTPYLLGGDSKKGIDCSAIVRRILREIYGVELPRVSIQQFLDKRIVRYADPKYLHEGDLVFFTLDNNKTVSHVGMYLQNSRFVNCDTEKGVCIRSLKAPYWKNSLVAYGRLKSI